MKVLAVLSLVLLLCGCNAVSQLSSAGGSGCIVGGFGTYGGSCTASVSGVPTTVLLSR